MSQALENQKLKRMKFYLLWRRTGDIVKAYADSFNISEELASKTLYEMFEKQKKFGMKKLLICNVILEQENSKGNIIKTNKQKWC